uniref:LEM domain-containing protein n=1 Tax=Syphacia muris TaxID=451379 RepID=A0A0N5ADA3_9BILA
MESGDIESLTNDQIRDELLSRGQIVGPIVETTRNLYLNRLKRLMNESESSASASVTASATATASTEGQPDPDVNNGPVYEEPQVTAETNNYGNLSSEVSTNPEDEIPACPAPTKPTTEPPSSVEQLNEADNYGDNNGGQEGEDDNYYGEESSRLLNDSDAKYMPDERKTVSRRRAAPGSSGFFGVCFCLLHYL